jgi:hypothetical protein
MATDKQKLDAIEKMLRGEYVNPRMKGYVTIKALKEIAKARGLSQSGLKDDLWDRINDDSQQDEIDLESDDEKKAGSDNEEESDDDDSIVDSEDEDENEAKDAYQQVVNWKYSPEDLKSDGVDPALFAAFRKKYNKK